MGFLRFLFAIAVVISHSNSIFGYKLISGGLAVQSFYIISGFYMALVLNEKYIGEHKSYKLFISNRLIRLYPTYWVVLACTVLFSVFCLKFSGSGKWLECLSMYRSYWDTMSITTIIGLIFSNVFIFFQDIFFFLSLNLNTGNLFYTSNYIENLPYLFTFMFVPQAWTIGLEILFYVCAPFLVRRKLSVLILIVLLSLLLRIILVYHGYPTDPWGGRFFPNELALFLLGAIAYKVYFMLKSKPINKALSISLFLIIIIFTLAYSFIDFFGQSVFFLALIFVALPHIFLLTKKNTFDRWIGDLSYPIYISHLLVYSIITQFEIKFDINFRGQVGIFVCLGSIVFSILLNQLIEIPLDKYRQKRVDRSIK